MSFEKNFCTSPWFHMRINNSGSYEYCRWSTKSRGERNDPDHNISTQSPRDYFQQTLAHIRKAMLAGEAVDSCCECYQQEAHGKVSGRQRQLLKSGIREIHWAKTLHSSPMYDDFMYSQQHRGVTQRSVSDWQIDLGNYCNSACVFCSPDSSSRLASEFKKIGLISQVPQASWCEDPVLLDRFIQDLVRSPKLRYLHFIGGETLITPGFDRILRALIDADIAQRVTMGFTTNLTVWDPATIDLLKQFQQVNLGVSVETLTPVNDYVRWPSQINSVRTLLDQWRELAQAQGWLMQLRITPTCLTIHELHTVYDYAWQHEISVESCNFLTEPAFLRIGVLPLTQRQEAINTLRIWIRDHVQAPQEHILNTRHPDLARSQILQDAQSYCDLLSTAPDESDRLPDLINYLHRLEQSRGNRILDHIPNYEKLLRSAGY